MPHLFTFVLLFFWLAYPEKNLSNSQIKLLILFIALIGFQVLFSRNKAENLYVLKNALIGILPAFLILTHFVNTPSKIDLYFRLLVIFNIFRAILGIMGGGQIKAIPFLADENDFSLYMNCLIPFPFFLAQEAHSRIKQVFYYGIAALFVVANITSFSRGGFVGLVAIGAYCIIHSSHRVRNFFAAFLIAILVVAVAPDKYWAEIQTINTEAADTGTGFTRVVYWKAGLKMFLDHPIIGVGALNYGSWIHEYHPRGEREWGRVAHSLIFTLIPEMGVIGTIIYLYMVLAIFKGHKYIKSVENNKEILLNQKNLDHTTKSLFSDIIHRNFLFSKALVGSLIGLFSSGLFLSVLWYPYFFTMLAYSVILKNITSEIETELINQ